MLIALAVLTGGGGKVNLVCLCMRVLRHMYVMCVYVSY